MKINRLIFTKLNYDSVLDDSILSVVGKVWKQNEPGLISAFKRSDLEYIRSIINKVDKCREENDLIYKACLFPPFNILKEFYTLVKNFENKQVISLLELLEK